MLRNLRTSSNRVQRQKAIEDETLSPGIALPRYFSSRESGKPQATSLPTSKSCSCIVMKKKDSKTALPRISWLLPSKVAENMESDCPYCSDMYPTTKRKRRKTMLEFALKKLPCMLTEREFILDSQDKIFASAWLNHYQVLIGTKCQKLIVIDTITGKRTLIPNIFDPSISSPTSGPITASQSSGIHSISINPSATLVAVGAGNPYETIQVFTLPSLQPYCLFQGHSDMVFSVQWINDNTLVSGSRDKTLKQWKIHHDYHVGNYSGFSNVPIYKYFLSGQEHQEKVRDVVINQNLNQTFTLSADGFVKIWDAALNTVNSSVPLNYSNETVCLSLDMADNLVSVGSQAHISIIDPRIQKVVHVFDSMDEGWGVRSMCINSNMLTIGGGFGRISFYDLRKADYISWQNHSTQGQKTFLTTGDGWLNKDAVYNRHFSGVMVKNAIYTLNFDPFNSKLFAAGGPLQLNLKGSYCSIWE